MQGSTIHLLLKRLVPIALFILALILFDLFIVDKYLSFDMLRTRQNELMAFVKAHPILTPLFYVLLYTISMALAIPDGFFLSIVGGFLFPTYLSITYVLLSEMLGTLIFFFLARRTVGANFWHKRAGPLLLKLERGFKENQVSYLLFLRFVHLIPFWVLNLASAYFRVPAWTFTWTTFVGFIPLAFIYTQAGAGLGKALATKASLSPLDFLTPKVFLGLICLGLIALIPILIRKKNT